SSTRTSNTEIYTLSLHDALPISGDDELRQGGLLHRQRALGDEYVHHRVDELAREVSLFQLNLSFQNRQDRSLESGETEIQVAARSEEHTSELQSRENLVCRLLLE